MAKLATLALLLVACEQAPRVAPSPPDLVRLERVVIDRFEQDRLIDRSYIERLSLDRVTARAEGVGVRALVYAADAERDAGPQAELSADRCQLELGSRVATLSGHARLKDSSGVTLETEALRYDVNADQLDAPGRVTLSGQNYRAEGRSLTGRPRAGLLEVGGAVHGTVSAHLPSR